MSLSQRTFTAFSVLSCLLALNGCAVVADVETYDAVATDHFSHSLENAVAARTYGSGCRWPCYTIGSSQMSIYPASRGSNIKALGPLLPVIPAPGPGEDHGEFDFFIAVHIHPGNVSLVIFRPRDFLIFPEGSDEAVIPSTISDCEDGELSPELVRVYGGVQCFKIEFPMPRSDLENFRMVVPVIESDGTFYAFPDLEWSPGIYRVVQ